MDQAGETILRLRNEKAELQRQMETTEGVLKANIRTLELQLDELKLKMLDEISAKTGARAERDQLQKDLDARDRLISDVRPFLEALSEGNLIDARVKAAVILNDWDRAKVADKRNDVLQNERAALLDPKSPGWNAGAEKLLKELKDRKDSQ